MTLQDLITFLCENVQYQMKNPGLTTVDENGKNRTLYMSSVKSIEERTRANLTQSLAELGLRDGQELLVADQTTPNTMILKLKYDLNEVEML
jgi:NEDD8-activating enzyme E1